jgi:hypothetical protein
MNAAPGPSSFFKRVQAMQHWKAWGIAAIVLVIAMVAVATYFITEAVMKKDKDKKNAVCAKYAFAPVQPATVTKWNGNGNGT